MRFDHVNIRVRDQEAIRDFLIAVVGVREGKRPPFSFHGYWLYLDDLPVIHLAPAEPGQSDKGWVDHIAFAGFDLETKLAELRKADLAFEVKKLPGTNIDQIFVRGPEGLRVELQCDPEERGAG